MQNSLKRTSANVSWLLIPAAAEAVCARPSRKLSLELWVFWAVPLDAPQSTDGSAKDEFHASYGMAFALLQFFYNQFVSRRSKDSDSVQDNKGDAVNFPCWGKLSF
eukprot:s4087_g9.t1